MINFTAEIKCNTVQVNANLRTKIIRFRQIISNSFIVFKFYDYIILFLYAVRLYQELSHLH